jgi:hypothetical protein
MELMKLRIRDNSIRLRLSRPEVETLSTDGLVSAKVPFPAGAKFVYCLESSPACVDPTAHFAEGELSVRLPETVVQDWAGSGEVSISAVQMLDDGGTLNILVEKDFECLAPRPGEDESDMFPHPQKDAAGC